MSVYAGLEIFHAFLPVLSYGFFRISNILGSMLILLIIAIPIASLKYYELKISPFNFKYVSHVNLGIAGLFVLLLFYNSPLYMAAAFICFIIFVFSGKKWNIT